MGVAAQPRKGLVQERTPFTTATERADARWHRALVAGMVFALVFHVAVLFSVRHESSPRSPFSAAGPDRGDIRAAAGGGEGLTMVEVRAAAAPQATQAPTPIPVPAPVPEIVVEPANHPAPELAEQELPAALPGVGEAGTGGGSGTATGPGTATGDGEGGAGTEDSGDSGMMAPRPRGILIPPAGRPSSARGQEITVWVFVASSGRVLSDSTRLEPATSDGRYNRRLRQTVSDWVFEPARRAGRAVGAWYPFQIVL